VFREKLRTFLGEKKELLCADCRRRAETNPLRVFDCKEEDCKKTVADAPRLLDFICVDCRVHFQGLQDYLKAAGIAFTVNDRLVRGLDYYTRTTFEIQTEKLGTQNAVTGGGRYDGLVKLLGGPDHPATGFAVGMERLVALLTEEMPPVVERPQLFITALGAEAEKRAFLWVKELREAGVWVEASYESKGLKAQMKMADRFGARNVLMVGENELAAGKGVLRDMQTKEQKEIGLEHLVENLLKEIKS
jgi:histidyl-tRNA synthetase